MVAMLSTVPLVLAVLMLTVEVPGVPGLRTVMLKTSWLETEAERKLLTLRMVLVLVVELVQLSCPVGLREMPLMTEHLLL